MRNGPLTTILLVLIGFSAVSALALCWMYGSNARKLRTLQGQVANVQQYRNVIIQLAQDSLEYSKTHPAIDPILESANLKPRSATPAAAATKPAVK